MTEIEIKQGDPLDLKTIEIRKHVDTCEPDDFRKGLIDLINSAESAEEFDAWVHALIDVIFGLKLQTLYCAHIMRLDGEEST